MENNFCNQAIDLVQKAIEADNQDDYETALNFYRDALGRFTLAIKYEQNGARKKLLLERVEGYMKRAEELRDFVNKKESKEADKAGGAGKGGENKDGEDSGTTKEEDAETKKLRGALAGSIMTEKPDVKWDDVAGLERAKESLKETVIMPVKFRKSKNCGRCQNNALLQLTDQPHFVFFFVF